MTTVYFIRGESGLGKTTLAKKMAKAWNLAHIEADQYFMKDGEYEYDRSKIGDAHGWAQEELAKHVKACQPCVVSNTFIQLWELRGYLECCSNTRIVVITLLKEGERREYKNVHGVDDEHVQKQSKRWEEIPPCFISKRLKNAAPAPNDIKDQMLIPNSSICELLMVPAIITV